MLSCSGLVGYLSNQAQPKLPSSSAGRPAALGAGCAGAGQDRGHRQYNRVCYLGSVNGDIDTDMDVEVDVDIDCYSGA